MYKCKYFVIQELVSPTVYKIHGENAWMFFDEDVLRDLDVIREENGASIIINNSKDLTQCGLRENTCQIVKDKTLKNQTYISGHILAKAFDLHDSLGRNERLYNTVCSLIKKKKVKAFRRVENITKTPTWVHTDSFQTKNNELVIF